MGMKKADLEKYLGKKLSGGGRTPDRYGAGSAQHAKSRGGVAREGDTVPLAVKMLKKGPQPK